MAQRPQEGDIKLDNLTREDLKKIERSMKQPGFMGLLNEYMIEISDPKNKNEYDEYLRQMEREKELPKHMKIVQIKPRFCFRTFIVSQKNKKHEMKFFINMCESEYLEKPNCQPTTGENGFTGYNWKIPNSMGKIRYDQDKKGNPCQVVDIAFHPDTYYFAIRKEFKEMIINIALQAAEKQLGERKETLSRDYVILQNVKCKGADGKPALMPIRYIEGKIYNKGQGPTNQPERDIQGKQTKLQQEINKQKEEFNKEKQKTKDKQKQQEKPQQEALQQKKLVVDLQSGVQRPKYTTILTYPVDYSEFIDSPYTNRKKIPSAFNLEMHIPRVESMQQIASQTLEINEKKIVLKVADKYFIDLQWEDLKLKYSLITANAKAKFDKKKKSLRIIIPIDQTVKYEPNQSEEQIKLVKPIPEPQAIIQSETWKNKVLQLSQPSITVKTLQPQEVEQNERPSLVQEIDQEDIVQEPTNVEQKKIKVQNQEEQNQKARPAEKFSLRKYYNKQKNKEVSQSLRIGHVFQETADKIVIVFQLKNYKKQELKTITNKQEILIQWKVGPNLKYEHLKISDQLSEKICKVEVVLRLGFVAMMLQKGDTAKGKYYQKQSIIQVQYEAESEEQKINHFLSYFETLEQLQQKQRQIKQRTANEQRQAVKKQQEQSGHKAVRKTQQQQKQRKEITQQIKDENTAESARKQPLSLLPKEGLMRAFQPQFIEFEVPFIDKLD